jgi:cell wall-associated NlpC family hydrolase
MYSILVRAGSLGLLAGVLAGAGRTAGAQGRRDAGASVAAAAHAPGLHVVAARAVVQGPDIVRSARQFLGVRYRLGGTTPRAFDCSGFVRYVFALHGVVLPRTAHEQAAVGEAPAAGDSLEQGDLLFFWGGHGAQHIAIYMGGDSIIHASSTNHHVRIDRLTGGSRGHRTWFNQRLIAVRRVLPAQGVAYVPGAEPTFSFIAGPNAQW